MLNSIKFLQEFSNKVKTMWARKVQLPSFASHLEASVVIGLLAVFITIGFIRAFKLPLFYDTGWDEVMFIDPAINLYFDHGFNSSAWFAQTKNEFWAGYPPLYSILLYLFLKIFGFSIGVPRIVNIVLATITVVLIWRTTIRLKLISSLRARILLVALLIGITGIGIDYRSGRPDFLMALLTTTAFWLFSFNSVLIRRFFLVIIGILLPWSGLATIPYAVILGSIVTIFLRRTVVKEMLAIAWGIIIGIALLYCFYQNFGAWDGFINSIINNPTLSHKKYSFSPIMLITGVLNGITVRPSLKLGLIAIAIFIWRKISKNNQSHSLSTFGLSIFIFVPLGMASLGAYPPYYAWMVSIPLAICICAELSSLFKSSNFLLCSVLILFSGGSNILLIVIPIIFYLSFKLITLLKLNFKRQLSGLFFTITFFLWLNASPVKAFDLIINRAYSDYTPVETFVRKNIKSTDWVITDFPTYYAVKQRAEFTMYTYYPMVMSNDEKKRTSALILEDDKAAKIIEMLGGDWYKTENKLPVNMKRIDKRNNEFEFYLYRKLEN